jgi:phenylalanyl-tRNA synthetase beta chain
MKVLLSWLREFAPDIDGDPVVLGERMSALGLAVEDMQLLGAGLDGVVLAKVLDLRPHPDADKIQLVDVDAGDGEALQVCCGAFNMRAGDLIPFATVGTTMPDGRLIERRRLRGEWSNGMCCSAAELGVGADADGIMILTEVASDAPLGAPIRRVLGLEEDVLWDLEVNANRPDCLSVAGVARDLAADLGVAFAHPEIEVAEVSADIGALAAVEIVDPTLCGRFVARVLRGVRVGTSPLWLQRRLIALGMRPINNVVDVSNYVMLELGQPNHTYDLALVPGGHLRIRRANVGERLVTLDDIERELVPADGVIADREDHAIGIAGVMGGATTEISAATTDVLLEMAWWDPPTINRTVKRLQLRSEASLRFQRGADWGDNIDRACRRFAALLAPSGAELVAGQIDARGNLPDRAPISVRPAKVNALLGTDLDAAAIAGHLRSIGFGVAAADGAEVVDSAELAVTIPTWRWDTATETDVAEEVARLHGYAALARTVPKGVDAGGLSPYQQDRRLVRQVLVGLGLDEAQPTPFLAPGDLAAAGLAEACVMVANPLVAEESVLRTSLLPGLLKAVAYNRSHRNEDVRLFEIGTTFLAPPPGQLLPDEHEHLAVALLGEEAPAAVEVLQVLGDALALPNLQLRAGSPPAMHPTRAAEVTVAGRPRGVVGEVDPAVAEAFAVAERVAWLELDLGGLLTGPHGNRSYTPVSKYPSSDIDLAFVVPDTVAAAAVEASIRKGAGKLLVGLRLFDVYRGVGLPEGHRSLAYRLRLQAADRTLTDAEIAEVRANAIRTVEKQQHATLRA